MKLTTLATLLGTLIGSATLSPVASAQDLPELNRQLTIMSGVIETALEQDTRKDAVSFRSIDATYLAGQGVVFTIRTSSGKQFFNFDLSEILSNIPHMPSAPPAPDAEGEQMETRYEFVYESPDWEDTANEVIRRVEHIVRETDDRLREFRSDRRELQWEIRELERRNRDLEFELSTADKERKKEVEKELKAMQKEKAALEQKQQALALETKELAEEKRAELAKQKQAQEESYKRFLANFEASIADTLCSFGAGLRELPNEEHITFVLDDFARTEAGNKSDRVYIFTKKEIKRCVIEELSPGDMLANARVYSF
ncbi:hypothetical protein [Alteromonas lipolytica]|uniref:Uncharacterized protein n=1 Tax=Alteromonas lipolytica TaxID=1856405 RepID=A0A1E8FDL0_9ALTE|nr:hypothetical protein [Alteromonas lipolytica]OFI33846.1 hypothetical protein BFC17_19960 [Alteromonas lipolytica]GGF67896.1 hypothetical protein GCM10011338_20100 [Alteromonas lipolytica]